MPQWRGVRGHHSLCCSMKIRVLGLLTLALGLAPALRAQTAVPDLVGTWETETPDGPQVVTLKADSTASFGEETVQWRVTADTIFIQFEDEWVGYNFVIVGRNLTLSGGDLEEPVILERIERAGLRSETSSPPRPT